MTNEWGESSHKPRDGSLSYPYIRELENDIYGEWFTVDQLPSSADVERLRPLKTARSFEVASQSEEWRP